MEKINMSNMSNMQLLEAKKAIDEFLKYLNSEYNNIKKAEEEKS